ncbi:hypothetical protein [Aureimonas glaciei]|uniref:Uncharacterized protein n=1 Tax=Aureimonas glaciei TaxID=1776957 RepID=A0A916YFB6_9HYPH|nr:hypothetical protein [Aureimonas glaciei]GGD43117.1 hypothetical protein GCM10011335_52220 [Aureimonas glaciei]
MTFFDLSQPGFWVLAVPFVASILNLASVFYLRSKRRLMASKVRAALDDPRSNEADCVWISSALNDANDRAFWWLTALFAPALSMLIVYWSFREASGRDTPRARKGMTAEQVHVRAIELVTGKSPVAGGLWNKRIRREIEDLSHQIQTFHSPVPAMWLMVWAIIAGPFIGLAYIAGTGLRKAFSAFMRDAVGPPSSFFDRLKIAFC